MRRRNCMPLARGDAAVLFSGSNTVAVSVREARNEHCLVQLQSDPDDRRVVERSDLKPRNTGTIVFTQKRPNTNP